MSEHDDDWGISTADQRVQPRPAADHGSSPAQLREKVEALEKRIDQLEAQQSMWRGNKRPPAPIDSEDV